MKFQMDHQFNWPCEKIVALLIAEVDLCPMEELPNVSSLKILEKRRDGKKRYHKVEWCVHGQIPKIAQKILSPEMLTFVEDSVWDDDAGLFKTKIIPHFLKDKITCNTSSQWSAAGAGKTKRHFSGELIVKIPVVGPIIEMTIIDHLKKNNDKNAVIVRNNLTKQLGAPTA